MNKILVRFNFFKVRIYGKHNYFSMVNKYYSTRRKVCTRAPNEHSWQISAPQPVCPWLAHESEQIQNPSWQIENIAIL